MHSFICLVAVYKGAHTSLYLGSVGCSQVLKNWVFRTPAAGGGVSFDLERRSLELGLFESELVLRIPGVVPQRGSSNDIAMHISKTSSLGSASCLALSQFEMPLVFLYAVYAGISFRCHNTSQGRSPLHLLKPLGGTAQSHHRIPWGQLHFQMTLASQRGMAFPFEWG